MASDGLTFVDTNVLVYAHDRSEEVKQPIARALLDELWEARTGVLSTQVLQELYAVATRKFDPPMSARAARQIVAVYASWPVMQVDVALILGASELAERNSVSFWDALIVEAARRAGASVLATEDLQGGRRLGGVRIVNPFA
ncbi:MAG: PIN domain-containing protein [Chloroflexota bacterium]